jgi:TRAF-interacting protein
VICTELFLINSHISACNCGHIFHEDCLSKWLRIGQQTNCPQCRAKVKESNVIKRLYMTESDGNGISSTQALCSTSMLSGEGENAEAIRLKYEEMIGKIQELKAEVKDKSDSLALKSNTLQQVILNQLLCF